MNSEYSKEIDSQCPMHKRISEKNTRMNKRRLYAKTRELIKVENKRMTK